MAAHGIWTMESGQTTATERQSVRLLMDRSPLAVGPAAAGELIGVGRTVVYGLIQSGELPSLKIGRSRLVRVVELERWLERRQAETAAEAQR